jgi:hypothetical protein
MSTVNLDDQALGWTEEVDDIRTDRRLPPEVRAVYWKLFQRAPQDALMRRRVGSQFLGRGSAD